MRRMIASNAGHTMKITARMHALRAAQAASIALLCSAAAFAQDAKKEDAKIEPMTIGSNAPVPQIEKFVRGTEPTWFESGKVYVIEFWATWCGPCKQSMPHISDMADKYKGKVIFVGVSDEKVDTVTKFLDTDEWKQKARYNLATDPDRSTHKQYMEAAAQNGIPTAFIVKDNKVQWIGHPMTMDEPLKQVVDGTWNPGKYQIDFEAETAMARKQMERRSAVAKARKAGDWDAILKMIDEDVAAAPERSKASLLVSKFQILLTDANKPADGYKLGREIAAANKDNAMVLNQMAWFVVDNAKVKDRDLKFAIETAQQAVDASKGEDGSVIDSLARAYWESGNKAKAIEWQKKAIEKAKGDMTDELKETLKKYEGSDAPTATKKTSFFMDDSPATKQGNAPAAPANKPADAPATTPAGAAPAAPVAPAAPRAPRPAAKLTAAAEKTFPVVEPEGFDSTDAIVAFIPTASGSTDGVQRLVRAMRSTTDGGKIALRVATALMTDMQPMMAASMAKFGKAGSTPIPLPSAGAKLEVKMDGDSAATLVATDAEGKPSGQPTALVKADGKWWFDFDKAGRMGPDEGAQMAMMANMMGDSMRTAVKTAAVSTAKEVADGKFKTPEEANQAFSQTMQGEMMKLMGGGMGGMGGPGAGPGGGPGAGAPRAPRGGASGGMPAGPGGAPAGAAPAGSAPSGK
jgi:thiol-disulfide isomerase/thioredoxin